MVFFPSFHLSRQDETSLWNAQKFGGQGQNGHERFP